MSDDRFNRVEDKLDSLNDKVADLSKAVSTGFAVYNEQLQIHIKGTNDNRDAIRLSNSAFAAEIQKVRDEISPIVKHVDFLKKLGIFLVRVGIAVITIGGFVIAILEYVK